MMRKVSLLLLMALCCAAGAAAQTVDEIIAKNIAARGGMEKLRSVKSFRITGKMTLPQGLEIPIVGEAKRPNSVRQEGTFQGITFVQAYDGANGWKIMPFEGKKDPEALSADELKEFADEADIDGALVDYKTKGNKVELIGKESVDGTNAYKLKLTRKSGDIKYIYLDADSFLEIKSESKRTIRGSEQEFETISGDYKAVDGIVFAHSFETGPKGGTEKQKITAEKIELNVPIDDARFKMPEVKKPEAAKPEVKKPEPAKPEEKKPPVR
ncbi:MAG: outer membrane lipoprotein-sorting protein [Acidobacteria bacterium]|nr:outer membrane lipoprotein-sorting protein [Acidobacteriota bacterium]